MCEISGEILGYLIHGWRKFFCSFRAFSFTNPLVPCYCVAIIALKHNSMEPAASFALKSAMIIALSAPNLKILQTWHVIYQMKEQQDVHHLN